MADGAATGGGVSTGGVAGGGVSTGGVAGGGVSTGGVGDGVAAGAGATAGVGAACGGFAVQATRHASGMKVRGDTEQRLYHARPGHERGPARRHLRHTSALHPGAAPPEMRTIAPGETPGPRLQPRLRKIAAMLRRYPEPRLEIAWHTDSDGEPTHSFAYGSGAPAPRGQHRGHRDRHTHDITNVREYLVVLTTSPGTGVMSGPQVS